MITADDLVRREVCHCASSLISTLAGGMGDQGETSPAIRELTEQAFDLAMPIDDWEEAAIQAGWELNRDGYWWRKARDNEPANEGEVGLRWISQPDASSACEWDELDPYQREVYEHWIVTDWLADKLEAHGEKVDKDFAGMCIWARTTTGQNIAADHVIKAITAEVNAA